MLILPLSSHAAVPLKAKRLRIVGSYPVRLICPGTIFFLSQRTLALDHMTPGLLQGDLQALVLAFAI